MHANSSASLIKKGKKKHQADAFTWKIHTHSPSSTIQGCECMRCTKWKVIYERKSFETTKVHTFFTRSHFSVVEVNSTQHRKTLFALEMHKRMQFALSFSFVVEVFTTLGALVWIVDIFCLGALLSFISHLFFAMHCCYRVEIFESLRCCSTVCICVCQCVQEMCAFKFAVFVVSRSKQKKRTKKQCIHEANEWKLTQDFQLTSFSLSSFFFGRRFFNIPFFVFRS